MTENPPQKNSIHYDFEQEKNIEKAILNINKTLIIHSHHIQLKDSTNTSIMIWLNRLEFLFEDLKKQGFLITEDEKMNITIKKMNDEIFDWYLQNKVNYNEFKNAVLMRNKAELEDNHFNINEWVRIYDETNFPFNRDKFETGFINKILENDVYEIMCKGKILKIQGTCIEKL